MKLIDLQEVRYHVHPIVAWIEDKIRSGITKKVCLSHDDHDPSGDEHQLMLRELTKEFGDPKEDDVMGQNIHYLWKVRDYKIQLFLWDFDSTTKKHLDVPRAGVCVYPPGAYTGPGE